MRNDIMLVTAIAGLVVALGVVAAPQAESQASRNVACDEWRGCRELALAAAERGEFEAFHDLAWRAVQTGPRNDPALMYLLARAQSLSGRPHDALVMLDRLAEMGVASDAAANGDFSRTRALAGWPEVNARIERVNHPIERVTHPEVPLSAPAPASSTPSPAHTPASLPTVLTPAPLAAVVRFSTERFAMGGLAYDAVSHRFLFGDRLGRKVIVVPEGSTRAIDLVRAESAGFEEIAAIEIDARRGDLWVASNASADGAGTVHRLQLVAGRPLNAFHVAADFEPVKLVDLAVTPAGTVLVLDALSRQLLVLRAGGTSLERAVRVELEEPTSLAAAESEEIVYIAHRDGVSRIDLRARTAALVAAPNGVSLARLERIRWYRHALIGVEVAADGSRGITRLELNASGRAVTHATRLEPSIPPAGPTFVTMSEDELVCFAAVSDEGADRSSRDTPVGLTEFVAYRIRLR